MTRIRLADKNLLKKVALRLALVVGLGVAGISLAIQAVTPAVMAFLR